MNFRCPLRLRHAGFTRVELVVVIAIIAICMGLFFPGRGSVNGRANNLKAKTDLQNTVAAVKQFYVEYGAYPLANQATNMDIIFGDKSSGASGKVIPNNQ